MKTVEVKFDWNTAQEFVNTVKMFLSEIDLAKGRYTIDAKSLMGVLTLDCSKGATVTIHSNSDEEIYRFEETMKKFK